MRVIILSLMFTLMPFLAQAKDKVAPPEAKSALGPAKPAPEEVKRVLDYFLHGKGMGPVLIETKLCRDIISSGPDKNECGGYISTHELKKGESVYLWMAYMVPFGDQTQNIVILFEKGGVTRNVENLQVSSEMRNRSWIKISLDTPGAWQLNVVRDTGSGPELLGTFDVMVK